MVDIDTTTTSGVEARGYRRGVLTTDSWDQYVIPVRDRISNGVFRANSFRIAGIAGTTGQKLLTLHNATGSTVLVEVRKVFVDAMYTAAKVVAPPIIRIHKITVLPTGGASCPKVSTDSGSSGTNSAVTCLQAASSDTVAATLTATIPANSIVSQTFASRALTLTGYETFDRAEFMEDAPLTLRALEGICVNLDYSVATSNAVSDIWIAGISWEEYTRP